MYNSQDNKTKLKDIETHWTEFATREGYGELEFADIKKVFHTDEDQVVFDYLRTSSAPYIREILTIAKWHRYEIWGEGDSVLTVSKTRVVEKRTEKGEVNPVSKPALTSATKLSEIAGDGWANYLTTSSIAADLFGESWKDIEFGYIKKALNETDNEKATTIMENSGRYVVLRIVTVAQWLQKEVLC